MSVHNYYMFLNNHTCIADAYLEDIGDDIVDHNQDKQTFQFITARFTECYMLLV